jgi:two-component system nitrogen regulation response regulator GlnG/two-component system response regulator HydG
VDATTRDASSSISADRPVDSGIGLVVLWAVDAPRLVGTVLLVPRADLPLTCHFGRGTHSSSPHGVRLQLTRQRPGSRQPAGAFESPYVSRNQLEIVAEHGQLRLENRGRCPMLCGGRPVRSAAVVPGDTVELKGQLLFICVERGWDLGELQHAHLLRDHEFGLPDAHGIVGESAAAWALRDAVAFVAPRSAHVLVHGASGTGKELVACAIHEQSSRSRGPLVARNAATLPAGLIDAELFGNAKDYPHAGMPARPGLIGQAHGGTLLLDEIGDLPVEAQTHLLRVLDGPGEYQRLGESQVRRSDFRLIAATNRPVADLRPDLAARLGLRVGVPSLNERRDDIGLIVAHQLRHLARSDGAVARRFCDDADGQPGVDAALVAALARHQYHTHVRELTNLLWVSIGSSPRPRLTLTPEVAAALEVAPRSAPRPEVTRELLLEAMERRSGVREQVWRDLGLANRHVLKRLLRKHGIAG